MNKPAKIDPLKTSVGDFQALAKAMTTIAELAPERMTLSQAIFFVQAAADELKGEQPTYSSVREKIGDNINRSLHTTYRVLLGKSRLYPKGLSWLKAEVNPDDNREKFLQVTPKGREVLSALRAHLSGLRS